MADEDKKYLSKENAKYLWDEAKKIYVQKMDSLTFDEIDIITGSASSINALIALIEQGGEIELDADVVSPQTLVVTKDTEIDLRGHTIRTNANILFAADGAKLTIKNGELIGARVLGLANNGGEITIESGSFTSGNIAFAANNGSKLVMNGGNITCLEGGLGAYVGSTIIMNAGRIVGIDNFPIFTYGLEGQGGNTLIMNGGELLGRITTANYIACGVYIANNDTFIMNGGKIYAEKGCGILQRGGTVEINDGEVEATGNGETGWVGDDKRNMSESAVIFDEKANYPGGAGMSLAIHGGKFTGVSHSLEILSDAAEPAVTVTGGEFIPAYN